ncbi:MAG: PqqD family protein [Bryobacteraceae bacterium]
MSRSFTADPEVMTQQLGDTVVLLHLRTDKFYELNPTAALAWQLLSSGLDTGEIASRITAEFDVSSSQVRRELDTVTAVFERAGLIR